MMFCPDGSCISTNGTCSTPGPFYTSNTGCRAINPCPVGNRGLLIMGEDGSLYPKQGGAGFSGA